ncbi:MAG: insulinase family protein [Flavobacteriales bacterium]
MKTSYILLPALALLLGANLANAQKEKPVKPLTKEKLDRTKRPQAGPAPEIKMGDAKSFTLPNGLKVFVVENHKLPKVTFSLNFDINPFLEGEKTGASAMAGELLGTATTNHTKEEINKKVDFIGARLNTGSEGISGACLKKHSDELLSIMSDLLLNAKFTEEELKKIKDQTLSGLSTVKTDPNSMMNNAESAIFFGKNHPYGEVQKTENVEKITLDDCKNYYSTYVRPNISYLTIVGDVTLEEAKAMADKYFAGWQKGDVVQNSPESVKGPSEIVVAMIDKPNAPQSLVHIGYPLNIKPGNADDAKIKLLNEVLGGGASARLFKNIRETYNYSYGAYSYFMNDEFAGRFVCFADVRTSATDSSIREFMKELKRITSEPVLEDELVAARNNLAGTFSISLERPSTVAQFALNIEKYGLPTDYYKNYLKRLEAVTVDDVLQTARKYINPNKIYIVVVGDKQKLESKLKGFATSGKVVFYDAFGDAAAGLRKAPAGLTGQMVLDDYINAIGGVKALKKIKDETIEMVIEVQGQKITSLTQKKVGGMMLSTQAMGPTTFSKTICDGKKAKSTNMMTGNKDTFTPEEMEDMKHQAEIYSELKYVEWGYTLNLLGIDKIDGKDVYKVEVIRTGSAAKSYEYFDVQTALKVRSETVEGGVDVSMDYKDYREVNKIKYPYVIGLNQGGQAMTMKVTKLELNKKLKATVFAVE